MSFTCHGFYSQALMCSTMINWASILLTLKPFLKFNIDSKWLELNSTQLKLTQVIKSDSSWVKLQPYSQPIRVWGTVWYPPSTWRRWTTLLPSFLFYWLSILLRPPRPLSLSLFLPSRLPRTEDGRKGIKANSRATDNINRRRSRDGRAFPVPTS